MELSRFFRLPVDVVGRAANHINRHYIRSSFLARAKNDEQKRIKYG